ncbi:MAG: histidinol dehydrogenase [Hyphomonadaceae bacterium]
MARILDAADAGFARAYAQLIAERGQRFDKADAIAREIVARVRTEGLPAVLDYTQRFDKVALTADSLRVTPDEIERAYAACPRDLIAALEEAAERIAIFHARERPQNGAFTDAHGVSLGWRWNAVDAAGLYAPGGLAAYPSSVLMNAVPAKSAGVKRLAMATPPARLMENPAILAAAKIAGVDEIWKIGGAQAIAALAYGAGPLQACDVVVGPGRDFVAAAKKIVFGDVGVDAVAGPSEVFILCDGGADPRWIAADLLAQAEHDADAQSVLFVTDRAYAEAVADAVEAQLAAGQAGASARQSWQTHGAIVIVRALEDAAALVDRAAPEHVQIAAVHADRLAGLIRHAGALFLGLYAPEALGDYVAGPSHVLPTTRAARFSAGVSTYTFMKRTSVIGADEKAIAAIGPAAARIADAEGLPAHARSIRIRLGDG